MNDMVQEVRVLAEEVSKWAEHARPIILSGKKLDMSTAKTLVESGEKLKVNTEELRTLRAALKAVRKWTNRVKKCDLDQGDTKISTVSDLINEHESLLIEMPDDLARLHQATQAYCICRRPYEGFMIGCDECGEWYHGPCIGVSQARADRFDKFVCVRCSMKNLFKNSAIGAVEITKKWTSRKCLKKARQVEHQKHQRKVRKETKDMEKLQAKLEKLEGQKPPEQTVPEEPKANTTGEENATADGSTAEEPVDKCTEAAQDKPAALPPPTSADESTETQTERIADTVPETPVDTAAKAAETTVDKTAETTTEAVAEKTAETASVIVGEKPDETQSEIDIETSSNKSTNKADKPAEVVATESEKPQRKFIENGNDCVWC